MSQSVTLEYQSPRDALAADAEKRWMGLALSAWVKIAVVTVLFAALFWPNLRRLWEKTNPFYGEANWGHAMGVPIIGLYYLYLNRDKLLAAKARTSWWGLLFLLLGVLIFVYGIYPGQNDFVKDFGMVVTLFGVVLLLAGGAVMKIAWFPIVFLICAIPWPGLLYSRVAGPLQALAANVAVWTLQVAQVKAFAGGTKIVIYGHNDAVRELNVAEACAGLRSLMTFISVGAALAFLIWSFRPLWQKLLITFSAIPIAIFCNVMRVSGQGLLDRYVSHELSESFAHQFVGLIMMIPAFFLLLAVGWSLDRLLIPEVDEKEAITRGLVRRSRAARLAPPPPARQFSPRNSRPGAPGVPAGATSAQNPAPADAAAYETKLPPTGFEVSSGAEVVIDDGDMADSGDAVTAESAADGSDGATGVAAASDSGTSAESPAAAPAGEDEPLPQLTPLPQITPPPARSTRLPPRTPLSPGKTTPRRVSSPRVPGVFIPPPPRPAAPRRGAGPAPKPADPEDAP